MARPEIEAIVRQVAGKYKFSNPDLLVATVNQESNFDPYAVGDNGHSRGIWQENDRGRGAGLQPNQSFDPYASTERAVAEFNATYRPEYTPGQWASAAQRPADRVGYARSIDNWLGSGQAAGAASSTEPWARDLLASAGGAPAAPPSPPPSSNAVGVSGGSEPWAADLLSSAQAGQRGTPAFDEGGRPSGGSEGAVWPVVGQPWGKVNNPFGGPQSRSAGATVALPSSNVGADLTANYGDQVVAPVSGTIAQVYDAQAEHNPNENSGWGGMTLLRGDDGYSYRLSHARPGSITVRPGQRVAQGAPLQQIGVSGNSTGPHLDAEKFDAPGHFVDITAAPGRAMQGAAGAVGSAAQTAGAWVSDLLKSAGR